MIFATVKLPSTGAYRLAALGAITCFYCNVTVHAYAAQYMLQGNWGFFKTKSTFPFQSLNLADFSPFRQGTSTIKMLSTLFDRRAYCAPTFVHNISLLAVTQCRAVHPRHLRFVYLIIIIIHTYYYSHTCVCKLRGRIQYLEKNIRGAGDANPQ